MSAIVKRCLRREAKTNLWRGVRVVDGDALEMRFGSNVNGGSNPPLSDYPK